MPMECQVVSGHVMFSHVFPLKQPFFRPFQRKWPRMSENVRVSRVFPLVQPCFLAFFGVNGGSAHFLDFSPANRARIGDKLKHWRLFQPEITQMARCNWLLVALLCGGRATEWRVIAPCHRIPPGGGNRWALRLPLQWGLTVDFT